MLKFNSYRFIRLQSQTLLLILNVQTGNKYRLILNVTFNLEYTRLNLYYSLENNIQFVFYILLIRQYCLREASKTDLITSYTTNTLRWENFNSRCFINCYSVFFQTPTLKSLIKLLQSKTVFYINMKLQMKLPIPFHSKPSTHLINVKYDIKLLLSIFEMSCEIDFMYVS